jgi:hypothetical protein
MRHRLVADHTTVQVDARVNQTLCSLETAELCRPEDKCWMLLHRLFAVQARHDESMQSPACRGECCQAAILLAFQQVLDNILHDLYRET